MTENNTFTYQTWHHVVGIYGLTYKNIFLDGRLVATGTNGTGTDGTGTFQIGSVGHTADAGNFKGYFDDIGV